MKTGFIIAALTFSMLACSKGNMPEGTPRCISKKIDEIKKEEVRNPPAEVYSYSYKGKTVYFIPQSCCDIPSELYDDKCNLICHPDGGITGQGDGKCSDFFSTRKNEKLIWKDNRAK